MVSRNHSGKSGAKNHNGSRRLAGGPTLPDDVCDWYEGEAQRVAAEEGFPRGSITVLLTRIARGNLDLTLHGIEVCRDALRRRA